MGKFNQEGEGHRNKLNQHKLSLLSLLSNKPLLSNKLYIQALVQTVL